MYKMLRVLRRILAPDVIRTSLFQPLLNWHDFCNNYSQDHKINLNKDELSDTNDFIQGGGESCDGS